VRIPKLGTRPQFIVENQFGSERRFKIGVNVGYRAHGGKQSEVRERHHRQAPTQRGYVRSVDLGTYSLGLSYRVLDALDLVGETYASYQLAGESDSKQKLSEEFVAASSCSSRTTAT